MIYTAQYLSPLGSIALACDNQALLGLGFEDSICSATVGPSHPLLDEAKHWLDIYFSGHNPSFSLPLRVDSTPFRKRVCEILLTIPYGKTMTYGEIAAILAKERGLEKMSAQAVGGAVGHNPIAIMIPCHRVVGSNGNLTGYAGGLDRKVKLLSLEGLKIF